jgi:hypothetical protein
MAVPTLLGRFGTTFQLDDFVKARNSGEKEDLVKAMYSISVDLTKFNRDKDPPPSGDVAFVAVHSYMIENKSTGVGTLNDACTAANFLCRIGFQVYFIHNPKKAQYFDWLQYFLKSKAARLFVYWSGIGAAKSAGPGAGKDEQLYFNDGWATDDELAKALGTVDIGPKKVIIACESCHAGFAWNVRATAFNGYQLSPNILSIASRIDSDKPDNPKLSYESPKTAGLFSFYLFRLMNDFPGIKIGDIRTKINAYLATHQQYVIYCGTSEKMVDVPFLPMAVAQTKK